MAPSYDPKLRSDASNSTSIMGAIIKHIAADNPTQLADATGRLLTWAFEQYIITPLSWIASPTFIMVSLGILLLLNDTLSARRQATRCRLEVRSRQIREEQIQRAYEEQLQREEAEWQTWKDEIIRPPPTYAESLGYISVQPEEF